MEDENGKIFIGYRENCSLWQAYTVYTALNFKHERLVFIDKEDPGPGDWKEHINALISSSEHYALVLTPDSFREEKEEDVLLWEITIALETKRNIVQFWFDNFDWEIHKYKLKNELVEKLLSLQGGKVSNHNALADIGKINDNLLVKKDVEITPVPEETRNKILIRAADNSLGNIIPNVTNLSKVVVMNELPSSDDFSSTGDYLGMTRSDIKTWVNEFYIPLISASLFPPDTGHVTSSGKIPKITLEPFPRGNERYASIKVHNQTDKPIECMGILKSLEAYISKEWKDAKDAINPGNNKLSWHMGSEGIFKEIAPGDHEVLNIAKLERDGALEIVFTFSGNEPSFAKTCYRLWVQVQSRNGEVLGNFFGCLEPTILRSGPERLLDELYIGICDEGNG